MSLINAEKERLYLQRMELVQRKYLCQRFILYYIHGMLTEISRVEFYFRNVYKAEWKI